MCVVFGVEVPGAYGMGGGNNSTEMPGLERGTCPSKVLQSNAPPVKLLRSRAVAVAVLLAWLP